MVSNAFAAHAVPKVDGKWRVEHADFTWVAELVVNGREASSPFTIFMQVWMPAVWDGAQSIELMLRPQQVSTGHPSLGLPAEFSYVTPYADESRSAAVTEFVGRLAEYLATVDSVESLRERYAEGDFQSAFVYKGMQSLLAAAP